MVRKRETEENKKRRRRKKGKENLTFWTPTRMEAHPPLLGSPSVFPRQERHSLTSTATDHFRQIPHTYTVHAMHKKRKDFRFSSDCDLHV